MADTAHPPYPAPAAEAVAALLARSNRLGHDPKNTNYAGGNASAKGTDTDPVTGKPAELLWVKGSGGDLGTLTEAGLAVLRLDALRALVRRLPGRRARGRDGRRVRLLRVRQGRRRPVDRHRDARPGRGRARRPPAPRRRHRVRDRGGRRGADPRVLRRPGRVGALAPPGLPARPRHRRDQARAPGRDRRDPRRPRHHRLGGHAATSARRAPWRSSRPRRSSSTSGASRTRSAAARRAAAGDRTPRPGRGPRPVHPRPRRHRQAAARPLQRPPGGAGLRGQREARRARGPGHVLPRPLPAHQGAPHGARPAAGRAA